MCGLFGIFSKAGSVSESSLRRGIQTINHRGPESQGVWLENIIGFAHARLSIHDLSKAGHQPMQSHSGRFVITFNGEIYNFKSIRSELQEFSDISFKSNCDTEVLVNAIDIWGLRATLERCVGMFAFAVWDRKEKKLFLARDRFGEKPIYYGKLGDDFVFASELKPIHKIYDNQLNINRNTLASYMRYAYVPSPQCIFQDLQKVMPGQYLEIDKNFNIKASNYWESGNQIAPGRKRFCGTFDEAVQTLDIKLMESLKLQMSSDVPLGAFLSGGIDSSLIVALMQNISSTKVNTFTIGFEDRKYNEAEYARKIASHLGSSHSELYVTENDALDVVPKLSRMYDEPFADSSQIPTFLVSQLAKSKVTVALTGDAGDELFGGYNRYSLAKKKQSHLILSSLIHKLLKNTPTNLLRQVGKAAGRSSRLSEQLLKLQQIARACDLTEPNLYTSICSQIYTPELLVLGSTEPDILRMRELSELQQLSYQEWMMFVDSQTYMTDDILVKVDRAAMAVSLETRVPFLDHRIFEFAWSLPLGYKIQGAKGKRVLRELLYKYVPRHLIDRPKMGFGVPIDEWLRGNLKEWASSLLSQTLIEQQGYLNPNEVKKLWNEHQSGRYNRGAALWTVLMFQSWFQSYN